MFLYHSGCFKATLEVLIALLYNKASANVFLHFMALKIIYKNCKQARILRKIRKYVEYAKYYDTKNELRLNITVIYTLIIEIK